jgi:hypothetical protein
LEKCWNEKINECKRSRVRLPAARATFKNLFVIDRNISEESILNLDNFLELTLTTWFGKLVRVIRLQATTSLP